MQITENPIKTHNYVITNEPVKTRNLSYELEETIEKCYDWALAGKRSGILKIKKAIKRFPKEPVLKNHLLVLYSNLGGKEEKLQVKRLNKLILEQHPDYLFAKTNMAMEYFQEGQFDEMPKLLGEELELKSLYPEREVFHVTEAETFFQMVILYYCGIGDLDNAEKQLEDWDNICEKLDREKNELAREMVLKLRMRKSLERIQKNKELAIEVEVPVQPQTDKTEPPKFNHSEINYLYENGFDIDKEILAKILSLPRESLIADLENVIKDSVERFTYMGELDRWTFPAHAIYLLGELKAIESLDTVFFLLKQSQDYYDFYFGDMLTEDLWEPIYKITQNDLDKLFPFICLPGIYTFAKMLLLTVHEQAAYHQRERHNEIVGYYEAMCDFFLSCSLEDNVIDSTFLGGLTSDIMVLNAKELLPKVKQLYDRNWVDEMYCGSYEYVEKEMEKGEAYAKIWRRDDVLPIAERYEKIANYYGKEDTSNEVDANYDEPKYLPDKEVEELPKPKIGRNDPCYCGSGKKYKKCCLNK